jgi:hypothetical protein
MIVGPNSIWLHVPKCGGHTVEMAIRLAAKGRRDIAFDRRDPFDPGWHDSIRDRTARQRGFHPAGKIVVAGFRRLPFWLLSRVHFEAARPPYRCATREMICRGKFYERDGIVNRADNVTRQYSSPPVDRWIRLEHLADDFARQFTDILGPRTAKAAARLGAVTRATPIEYVNSIGFWFTLRELEALYEANPGWAGIERAIDGDLLRP